MSASSGRSISAPGFAAAVFIPTVLAGLIAMFSAFGAWTDEGFFTTLVGGIAVGAIPALAVALLMAWHGSSIGAAGDVASTNAPLWGLVPGALAGLSLPWFLGFLIGYWYGYPLMGLKFGFFSGIFWGVLSWQIGYWATRSS